MYPLTVALVIGAKKLGDEVRSTLQTLGCQIVLDQSDVMDWSEFLAKLERLRPSVALYDVTGLQEGMEEPIEKIRALPTPPAVFAVDTSATPQRVLRAIHAGAAEFIFPPVGAPLKEALEKLGDQVKRQVDEKGHGRIAAFVSAKGGCGATTIAAHSAMEIVSLTDERTLLADLDLESGLISFLMGSAAPYSLLDVLQNLDRLDASFWKGLVSEGRPGVDVLGSAPMPNYQPPPTSEQMHGLFRFLRTQYGAILLDLGRSVTPMLISALEHVDQLFLITALDIPALHRTERMVAALLKQGCPEDRLRVIVNRMPKDPETTVADLEKMIGAPIFLTVPSDYPALYECYSEGRFLPASHRLSKRYAEVAAHILGVSPRKKRFSLLA